MSTAARDAADWRLRAACRGQDTNLWFIDSGHYRKALTVCGGCPVRVECLHDALTTESSWHRYGLWGGLTGNQRRALPALPTTKAAALTFLREHLAAHEAERTPETMTTSPAPEHPVVDVQLRNGAAVRLREPEALPVGQLLKWGDEHPDAEVRDQAARARAALAGLRQRHAADQELTAITTEAAGLEKRLAELRAREAELAPAPKKVRKPVDYPAAEVRVWAREQNIACPAIGRVPKAVVDAWRAAQEPK